MTTTAPTQTTSPTPLRPAAKTIAVPRDPNRTKRRIASVSTIIVLLVLHALAFRGTEIRPSLLVSGWSSMMSFLGDAFPPDLDWAGTVKPALDATGVTLWIGLLGTTLSIPTALLLAILGARTVTPNRAVYQVARSVLSFFRAVPDIVFALIFVTAVGLGPFAGVLALICHNTGVMGKLWAEAMEEIDSGPQEALRAAGANRVQQVAGATLPMVVPQWTGLLLYRFDVNVRSSLVLGLVGAGGIGLLINRSIQDFRFDQMLTQILIVLALIIVVDQVSAFVRRRLAQ